MERVLFDTNPVKVLRLTRGNCAECGMLFRTLTLMLQGAVLDMREEPSAGCFRHNRNTENGSENVTGEIED